MKVGLNFQRDLPFLDLVYFHYFRNREIKCDNCKDFLHKKCNLRKSNKLEIRDCMIRKVISDVHESNLRGVPLYTINIK